MYPAVRIVRRLHALRRPNDAAADQRFQKLHAIRRDPDHYGKAGRFALVCRRRLRPVIGEVELRRPLEALIGPAWVVDGTHLAGEIDQGALEGLVIPASESRLLFKTPNSALWAREGFSDAYIGLTDAAARALVARGIALVGADYLSIAPHGKAAPTHHAFLKAGVVILEGIDLREIEPGPYDLVCLPLRIMGCDGAPARALLHPR